MNPKQRMRRKLAATSFEKQVFEARIRKLEAENRELTQSLCKRFGIESELGIDLVTLFKALDTFYAKNMDCYCARPVSLFRSVEGEWSLDWMGNCYKLKDYKRTWALIKEEFE